MTKHIVLGSVVSLVAGSAAALAGPPPVVGGHLAVAGQWPDVVAALSDTAACSGSLIAPDLVLTAGHCIGEASDWVEVGTLDYGDGSQGERVEVAEAHAYPSWMSKYDVGVLVLAHPVKTAPAKIMSACTAAEAIRDGADVQVVGFGLTSAAGTDDNSRLHYASLRVSDAACTNPDCQRSVQPDGEFVAGGDGKDACFGDSGGPIYVTADDGTPAVAGVVSRGMSDEDKPCGGGGIYVRADAVVPWIEKVTKRTLARTSCGTDGKGDGEGDGAVSAGGCDAGGGGSGAVGLVLAAAALVGRRRA